MPSNSANAKELLSPWQEQEHAVFFDGFWDWSNAAIKRYYESLNDIQMLRRAADRIKGRRLVEIGCATGDLYRYVRRYHPVFDYVGVDISVPAVARARDKYPTGAFHVITDDLAGIKAHCPDPDLVFCKDVLLHQPDPFVFLKNLLAVPGEALIFRLRTRDLGKTVLDAGLSCQKHYSGWVPYMILNLDETIAAICAARPVVSVEIVRHYIVLGGYNGRFLPKDCYLPETGTAETSIFVKFAADGEETGAPNISIRDAGEAAPPYTLWDRARRLARLRLPCGRTLFRNR